MEIRIKFETDCIKFLMRFYPQITNENIQNILCKQAFYDNVNM